MKTGNIILQKLAKSGIQNPRAKRPSHGPRRHETEPSQTAMPKPIPRNPETPQPKTEPPNPKNPPHQTFPSYPTRRPPPPQDPRAMQPGSPVPPNPKNNRTEQKTPNPNPSYTTQKPHPAKCK